MTEGPVTEGVAHGRCPTCGIAHARDPDCKLPRYDPNNPVAPGDPVIAAVCRDLQQRSALGIAKYGKTLMDNPLAHREWLQHAYEEALDLANYLKTAMMQLDAAGWDGQTAEERTQAILHGRRNHVLSDDEFKNASAVFDQDEARAAREKMRT